MFKRVVMMVGIGAFALVGLFFSIMTDEKAVAQGQTIESAAVDGMMVRGPGGRIEIGTVFVAEVPGLVGKNLCTSEGIASLANQYGVSRLNPGLELQGDFVPVGEPIYDGAERISCATVVTDWPAFFLSKSPAPSGRVTVLFSNQNFVSLDMKLEEGGQVTKGWKFQPYHEGSPLTLGGLLVYGVLTDVEGGVFTPFGPP